MKIESDRSFRETFAPSELVGSGSDGIEPPETTNDYEVQSTFAIVFNGPNQRVFISQLIITVHMKPFFYSNTCAVNNSDQCVLDSETAIVSSLNLLILTTTAQNVRV